MKSETDSKHEHGLSSSRPVIVDLGKIGGKKVKQLKKGEGIYLEQVVPAVQQVRESLDATGSTKDVLVVVVLYQRKTKSLSILQNLID